MSMPVIVRPGDVLVYPIDQDGTLGRERADAIRAYMESRLPGVKVVIAAGGRVPIIYRPNVETMTLGPDA